MRRERQRRFFALFSRYCARFFFFFFFRCRFSPRVPPPRGISAPSMPARRCSRGTATLMSRRQMLQAPPCPRASRHVEAQPGAACRAILMGLQAQAGHICPATSRDVAHLLRHASPAVFFSAEMFFTDGTILFARHALFFLRLTKVGCVSNLCVLSLFPLSLAPPMSIRLHTGP